MPRERILFVTGRLAEFSLRRMLDELAPRAGFDAEVAVLGISVAALMTPDWVGRQLQVPPGVDRVLLPGHCAGDLDRLGRKAGVPVQTGPKDLRELPAFFGQESHRPADYGEYDLEIVAEINHAPRLTRQEIHALAARYRDDGADVVDLGCDPDATWPGAGEAVRALVAEGFRVSIDSFNPREIGPAVAAGAELVLSVNSTNLEVARSLGCEVVAIPDPPYSYERLEPTLEKLDAWGVPFRVDSVLEPIGFGFAASLGRYMEVRRRLPEAAIMMGIANLTELTDADSAGINVLLIGFCQELGIGSVLTTEVINWARSSVREIDLARRLMHYACRHRVLPKHLEPGLVLLRDEKVPEHGPTVLEELARRIKDPNFRLFAEAGELHAMNKAGHWKSDDPFELFEQMTAASPVTPAHAFYLGYELAKAYHALRLGKAYRQDQPLDWGFLSVPERSGKVRSKSKPEDS